MSDITVPSDDFFKDRQLLVREYGGFTQSLLVEFTSDAWVDATSVAQVAGKRFNDWYSQKTTKDYIQAFIDEEVENQNRLGLFRGVSLTESDFVKVRVGGVGSRAWIHSDLVVFYARWINPKFGVWCDRQIKEILFAKFASQVNNVSQQDLVESNRLALASKDAVIASKDAIIAVQVGTLASQESVIQSLTVKLDSKSITILKEVIKEVEVMPIKYNMVGAIDFAEYYDIEPTDYVNRIFVAAGALTRLDKDYLVNPGYEHLLSNPINPYTNQVSTRRSVKYAIGSSGAITILKHKKVTLLPRYKVVIEDLTSDEISALPQGVLFMQVNKSGSKPTVISILDKSVGGLVDATKGANDVALSSNNVALSSTDVSKMALSKLPSVSQSVVKVSSEEGDTQKGDSSLPSPSNVVPIKAA